jgi:hypothetical protein
MEVSVVPERSVLATGEGTRVVLRVRNPNVTAAAYRLATRHLWARLVGADGAPFKDASLSSGTYRDEALVELAPGGVFEVSLPVSGTYARFTGSGSSATADRVEDGRLAPGRYAIQVFVGGLGGADARLVPVEVR